MEIIHVALQYRRTWTGGLDLVKSENHVYINVINIMLENYKFCNGIKTEFFCLLYGSHGK
jgi:hypothetical protein